MFFIVFDLVLYIKLYNDKIIFIIYGGNEFMGANEWLLYKLNELYLSTQQQMLETSDKQSLKILKK